MSQNEILLLKNTSRKALQNKLDSLSDSFVCSASKLFANSLFTLPMVETANNIFCYASVQNEPSTLLFIENCLSSGKNIFVPKCLPNRAMVAVKIDSLQELSCGCYGLLEPLQTTIICPPQQLDIIIAPCIACDTKGTRLGHGGGYYDRYLAEVQCPTICLCYEALLQKSLPSDSLDIPVDYIVTEKRVLTI